MTPPAPPATAVRAVSTTKAASDLRDRPAPPDVGGGHSSFSIHDGTGDAKHPRHRPAYEDIVKARGTGHRRHDVEMLEEVVDGQDAGQDEEHVGDGTTPALAREVLLDGGPCLLRLCLAGLRLALGTPSFDLLAFPAEWP